MIDVIENRVESVRNKFFYSIFYLIGLSTPPAVPPRTSPKDVSFIYCILITNDENKLTYDSFCLWTHNNSIYWI